MGTGIQLLRNRSHPITTVTSLLWLLSSRGLVAVTRLLRGPGDQDCVGASFVAAQNLSQEGVADQTTAVISGDLDGLITE